jgi:hypothetical protein
LATVVLLCPASAGAQTVAKPFEELTGIVKTEETIIVTDMMGRRVKGVLTAIDHDSLSLSTDGRPQKFARSEVGTIRVPDGLGNGALIGAGAGFTAHHQFR